MSIVKGTLADIKPEFLEKLDRTFPMNQAMYSRGDTLESVAYKAGQRSIIDWIYAHAARATFEGG